MNINEYLDYVGDDWSKGWLLRGATDHHGVLVPFSFLDLCDGNAYEALILAQIMYWSDVDINKGGPRLSHEYGGHLWIVKTYEEWAAEMHLKSWTTVRACITRLADNGLLIKETHKSVFHSGNTALFLRLNWEIFGQKIREWAQNSSDTPDPSDTPDSSDTSDEDISRNTSHVIPGNTSHVIPIYTKTTSETTSETPDESVEIAGEFPRRLANSPAIFPEKGEEEKEENSRRKYVKEVMAALSIAKIRFAGPQFQKRELLVEDAIIEFGLREVRKAVQESYKEKARWWSYVATRLRANRKITEALTGEDYITGKYADYIEH